MISLVRQRLLNQATNFQITRTFLTNQQLGIDRFLQLKEKSSDRNKDIVVNNIKSSLQGESGFVYTEDLKSLAYLIDTPEEAKLLKDAFIKFASNEETVRLASFKIGPVVSRALYSIDDLDSLKELFHHEKTSEYFQLRTAYNVYLSFLYKKEQYEEVLNTGEKIFENMLNTETDAVVRNHDLDNAFIVYLAAAYKIGDTKALERARKMIQTFSHKIMKAGRNKSSLRLKQVLLLHLLCVKNNELNEALEILVQFTPRSYEFLNAKAAIEVRLGRTQECIITLNKILDTENTGTKYILTETIEIIKQQLENHPDDNLKNLIESLSQDVILDAKIEDTIMALPNITPSKMGYNRQDGFKRYSFNRDGGDFNRFGGNRQFGDRNGGSFNRDGGDFNRFGGNRQFGDRNGGFNRFGGNRQFGARDGGEFNRYNDRQGNRFEANRYGDNASGDGSRRPFRPFQTKFRDVDRESSDII